MTGLAVILAQLVTPGTVEQPPDIELRARVSAERVKVKEEGEAKIELRVEPGEAKPVRVERSAPAGQRSYRNLTINLHAEALIADPAANADVTTTEKQAGEPE